MIPILDLQRQYQNIREEMDAAVLGVLESGHFVLGPNVKALEQEVARVLRLRIWRRRGLWYGCSASGDGCTGDRSRAMR